ncbi:MAG: hypothetical protein U9N87_01430 [Planctomycetota bacterium]|nr:hypothetical protein [Planctomycetota bacterium]
MTTTTTSFLMNCPQCGLTIPKGGPCEVCRWTEDTETANDFNQDLVREFAARRKVHFRNYAIFMVLAFVTGFVSLITAFMWFRVIYLGDIVAFVLVGFLTVTTGILGVMAACVRKLFPVDLNCPSCDIRLDELGTDGDYCPNCSAQLK